MEVEHADIEHELVIKGYLDGDEAEKLRTFHILPNAVLVEDGIESLKLLHMTDNLLQKQLGKERWPYLLDR